MQTLGLRRGINLHCADIWCEGGEDDLPVLAMAEDGLEDLVQEQVHLHHLLLLLPPVLNKRYVSELEEKQKRLQDEIVGRLGGGSKEQKKITNNICI